MHAYNFISFFVARFCTVCMTSEVSLEVHRIRLVNLQIKPGFLFKNVVRPEGQGDSDETTNSSRILAL